ncbi:MAG: type II toxin-antitoxin system VapC family toxin [Deltaproteobacteria bacterium]|nr:type II toxin-antitoxin system VapC family toxin [Deltaproteobacteria bacterium]
MAENPSRAKGRGAGKKREDHQEKATSQSLDDIPAGAAVFIDSSIFIFYSSQASRQCQRLLQRCQAGELRGSTSVLGLVEASHRLMMIEAANKGLVSTGNLSRKLARKPAEVMQLHRYQEQVERIPLMGIRILELDLQLLLRSSWLRQKYGVLTNDSLLAATALHHGISTLATGDRDFQRVEELQVYVPSDL